MCSPALCLAAAMLSGGGPDAAAKTAAELDAVWAEASRTVREGDYEAYAALYHPAAVLVSETRGEAVPIADALAGWKPGFVATKAGEVVADVEFRITKRVHGPRAAHETGLFRYSTRPPGEPGRADPKTVHFEAVFLKTDDGWKWTVERQVKPATEQEWDAAGATGG